MNRIEKMIAKLCPEGVEYRKLGEIGQIFRGTSFQKKHFVESGVPCIHYGQIYTYYGTTAYKTKSFVSDGLAKNKTLAKPGDLVIATTSENVEDVGKATVWLGDTDIMVSNHACFFRHKQNPKYVAYYFQTKSFFDFKRKYSRGTKVIDLNPKDLEKFLIPIPPMAVQKRIVEVLDKFTELTARRRQYEYYRNQLLSFGAAPQVPAGSGLQSAASQCLGSGHSAAAPETLISVGVSRYCHTISCTHRRHLHAA